MRIAAPLPPSSRYMPERREAGREEHGEPARLPRFQTKAKQAEQTLAPRAAEPRVVGVRRGSQSPTARSPGYRTVTRGGDAAATPRPAAAPRGLALPPHRRSAPPRPRRRPPPSQITAASPRPAAPRRIARSLLPPAEGLQRADPSAPPIPPPLGSGPFLSPAAPRAVAVGWRRDLRRGGAAAGQLRQGACPRLLSARTAFAAGPRGREGEDGEMPVWKKIGGGWGGKKEGGESRKNAFAEKKWGMKRFLRRGARR